jgi:DtxR family manganese transport transcriptional regulator
VHDQAARFDRVRRDHSGEIAEDYVQLVAQLIREEGEARTVEIARRLGVSHVTVTKTMARLRREGLIRSEPYRAIYLTRTGAELADKAQARHDLLVRFLRLLGVNAADAENDAEGMEHHVSEATIRAIQAFVERQPR